MLFTMKVVDWFFGLHVVDCLVCMLLTVWYACCWLLGMHVVDWYMHVVDCLVCMLLTVWYACCWLYTVWLACCWLVGMYVIDCLVCMLLTVWYACCWLVCMLLTIWSACCWMYTVLHACCWLVGLHVVDHLVSKLTGWLVCLQFDRWGGRLGPTEPSQGVSWGLLHVHPAVQGGCHLVSGHNRHLHLLRAHGLPQVCHLHSAVQCHRTGAAQTSGKGESWWCGQMHMSFRSSACSQTPKTFEAAQEHAEPY